MTTVARVITVSTTVALLSAPAFAQKVTYELRRGADFSELRTFSIRETPPAHVKASQTTAWDSPIVQEETNAAVAAQLGARGLRRDDAHPDMYVTTHRTFQTEFWGYGWPGWSYGYWGQTGYGSYYVDPIVASILFIDIRSAETGELLWRGISERNMHVTSSPEDRLERINKEVRKVFKNYPLGTVATSGRETPKPTDR
jgi:Domain of unknown function (DUF4136)